MFLFCNYIDYTSYADDNTPYCIGKKPRGSNKLIREILKIHFSIVLKE